MRETRCIEFTHSFHHLTLLFSFSFIFSSRLFLFLLPHSSPHCHYCFRSGFDLYLHSGLHRKRCCDGFPLHHYHLLRRLSRTLYSLHPLRAMVLSCMDLASFLLSSLFLSLSIQIFFPINVSTLFR